MKRGKLFPELIIALITILALLFGIMMRESGNTGSQKQISVIIDDSSDNRWVQLLAGMQQAAEDQNVKLTVMPTGHFMSLSEEKIVIERAVADGADGVIVQLCSDRNAVETLQNLKGQTYIELIDTGTSDTAGNIVGMVGPDHMAIGVSLAEEVLAFAPKPIEECTIGIIHGNPALNAMKQRMRGFEEVLVANGGSADWVLEQTAAATSLKERLAFQEVPDILVAMDNTGLEAAGEYASTLDRSILVIGAGTSTKAIYYLDSGIVQSMVVPEEFMMGYQSVSDLTEYFKMSSFTTRVRTVEHRIVHQDTIFTEENQGILFPIQR